MADIDRRRRFAARLKQLIPVAVEQKNVQGGVALARLIIVLEGWNLPPERGELPDPNPTATDMSGLLSAAGITTNTATAEKRD